MKRRRVKITGIGPVTPAGIGREEFWKGILEPVSRVGVCNKFPEEAGPFVAAEVKGFRLENYLPSIGTKRMPRHTQFALGAACLAIADAGLTMSSLRHLAPLVVIGASLMDFGSINKGVDLVLRRGPINALPGSVFSASVSSISGTIGEVIGGTPRTLALQSACCAGLDAIGHATQLVAAGEVDFALCGGTEAPLYFHPMLELKLAGLSPGNAEHPERQSRPFDLWRTTGVIGEGACVLLLEPESSPREGYGFIEGYAYASDPLDGPGAGLQQAIRHAIANAALHVENIESINAWGPGHKVVDQAEAAALVSIFKGSLSQVPAVSLKGAIGNPLGAAGAIQVAAAILGMRHSVVPPTVNWEHPDPSCPLNLSARPRFVSHTSALVNAHGLSGTNSCLVVTH